MKKFLSLILALSMVLSMATVVFAEDDIKVTIDRVAQSYDVMPVLENDRTLVPMRGIFEALGAEITWEESTETVTGVKGDTNVVLQIGNTTAKVNDTEIILDVPAKLINDRTMVPVRFISESLGCTVDWEDATQTVIITSPKKEFLSQGIEREFKLLQETFEGANPKSSSYNEFYSMAEPVFLIPGLNQAIVPQGIGYREDTNQFYLSGYFKDKSSSAICVVDAATGELCGEYFLMDMDGKVYSGHVGGIAVSEKDIYLSHGCYAYRISLATIDAIGKTGDLYLEEEINLSIGDLSKSTNRGCSYVDCTNGYLWVGNYYATGSSSYEKPIHENYTALVRAYKLDATQPSGIAAENKAKNTGLYDYVPDAMYFVKEEKIQGLTTVEDYIILSASGGASASKLHIYDKTKAVSQEVLLLDGDRQIPVIHLTPEKTVSAPPYSEEIVPANGDFYITFESGAQVFRSKSKACPSDSVWKIALDKLFAVN